MKNIFRNIVLVVVIFLNLIFISSCGKIELESPQNVLYDGTKITWDEVENADYYMVSIDGGNEYKVTTNEYTYTTNNAELVVKIKANSDAKKIIESSETEVTFKQLDKVDKINVSENGVLSWDIINNATGYLVKITNGQNVKEVTVSTPTYEGLEAGENQIQVKPIVQNNSAFFSNYSNVKKVTVLGSVEIENIKYENGYITWKYVSGASAYEIIANGQVLSSNCKETRIAFDADNNDFEVTIKAIGNGVSYFTGKESEIKKFIFLETVTNVVVEDGIVKWSEVAGATGYKVKINGTTLNDILTDTTFDRINANITTEIQIMPISDDTTYFSDWSVIKNVLILPSPIIQWNNDLELDGVANSNIYWDGIANASGYVIKITYPNGLSEEITFGSTQRYFQEAYIETGTYKVELKALAETTDSNIYDSKYSQPISITRLAAPKPVDQNYITSNDSDVDEGFVVTFKPVVGAISYQLYKDNIKTLITNKSQFNVTDVSDKTLTEEQTYNYKIQSIGSVENTNSGINVRLSSLSSESLSFEIKVLASPKNIDMSGYEYQYSSVSGANGYSINVGGTTYTSGTESFDLGILQAGNYNVSVCSKGNKSNVLPSNYTSTLTIQRLDSPTNIKIDTSEASEGVLSYNSVQHATGYHIVFNNDGNAIPVTSMMNINKYITEQGTTVYMQSVANYFNDLKTIYYMTSTPGSTSTFIKLSTPTFGDLSFSNTQLIWNAPENINTSIYTPTYEIYFPNGTIYNGEKNGTTMDISYLEGGMEYTFLVKAIGDGSRYINSDKSKAVSIYKLSNVEITRGNGVYNWNSVVNATSYQVYVDGELAGTYAHESNKQYSFTPKFTEIKTYKVEVIAVGDGGYTTVNSNGTELLQETKQLATPNFEASYSHKQYDLNGTIDVKITEESIYAKGYAFIIGGKEYQTSEKQYSHNPNGVGSFNVSVYALGGNFDEYGIYYLDSQTRGGANSKIIILAYPNSDSFTLSQDGYLKWANIDNAVKYKVEITIDNVKQEVKLVTNASILLEGLKPGMTLIVKVTAIGNDGNIVSSEAIEVNFNI